MGKAGITFKYVPAFGLHRTQKSCALLGRLTKTLYGLESMNSKHEKKKQLAPWVRGILAVAFAAMASTSVLSITSGVLVGWTMVFAIVMVILSLGLVFMVAAGRWTVAPNLPVRYQEIAWSVVSILWIFAFALLIVPRLLV